MANIGQDRLEDREVYDLGALIGECGQHHEVINDKSNMNLRGKQGAGAT